jgi:hypothetical protein
MTNLVCANARCTIRLPLSPTIDPDTGLKFCTNECAREANLIAHRAAMAAAAELADKRQKKHGDQTPGLYVS